MHSTAPSPSPAPGVVESNPELLRLAKVIDHAAHLLPAQGPITVFIHHNTLHAFEDLSFTEAVRKGAQVFGCQPYLSEDRYREELLSGRIRFGELQDVLEQDLGDRAEETIPGFGSRFDLWLVMLQYPMRTGPTEELVWYVAEAKAMRRVRSEVSSAVRARMIAETRRWVVRDLRKGTDPLRNGSPSGAAGPGVTASLTELLDRFGDRQMEHWSVGDWESFTLQALWRVCCDGVRDLPAFSAPPALPVRHRDLLFELTGADADSPVNDLLIRFCAAFLDQGLAHWPLPGREGGFYESFCAIYRQPGGPPDRWMRGLAAELGRLLDSNVRPLESIRESLALLGVAEGEWEDFLSATLLALRGWGGMLHQTELRGDRVVVPAPAGTLEGFIAVRLVLERFALAFTAREALDYQGPLADLREMLRPKLEAPWPPSVEQRAFPIFQLAQVKGISPDVFHRLGRAGWESLAREVEEFSGFERRRIFQMAYERRFYTQTLDAVSLHAPNPAPTPARPRFQVVCCLDEREESFRRHLEELAPDVQTFGVAGFYNVPIYYRGVGDAHYTPLCPVVIFPRHWITEEVGGELGKANRRRAATRRALGKASHRLHQGSRSFALGALLTGAVGVLASVPLVTRILFPRLAAQVRRLVGRFVQAPPLTRLRLERTEPTAGPEGEGVGFTIEEMTDAGERLLRDIGMTSTFARLVVLIGHGSNSMNNPHNSAYNCGACGGAAGGPNARTMAQILNDPRARERLGPRGLSIPSETIFLGAYHNTCNDTVVYFDVDRAPASHLGDVESARVSVESALDRNAHERCRRFMSAPLTQGFQAAREHVEGRSEDLAQPRPELGHATNAISVVGRRDWSRGLFLDRRAFLTSYDPTLDDADGAILTRLLLAVFPVCSGINLEYYFSNVDNTGFGCGSKLPHNVASLLGVMDGASSDLRTGLPWQMVEIHEPVRLLFIIETTIDVMLGIMNRNEGIGRLCYNSWVKLTVIHPETKEINIFRHGAFRPYRPQSTALPSATSSVDCYRGWRDHLEFAEIEPVTTGPTPAPEGKV